MATKSKDLQSESGPALRKLILRTSRQLLLREGYGSLSMRKIARSMGYSATTIYLHFRNKDQLVHALISDGMEILKKRLRPVLADSNLSPLVGIRRVCREYAQFGLDNPSYYEIMYVLHADNISIYPESRYRDARSLIYDVSQLFERGIEKGELRQSNPLMAANILWSQIHGVLSLIHSKRFDRQLAETELVDQAIDAAIRACLPDYAETETDGVAA